MRNDDFLLDREELIEGEGLLITKTLNNFIVGLRTLQSLLVPFGTDESLVGVVGLEDLPDHEDLLLVESLIEVALHLEIGVDSVFLRFAAAHVRWISYKKQPYNHHSSQLDAWRELEVAVRHHWALLVRLVEVEVVGHEELSQWVCEVGVEIEGGVGHIGRDEDLFLGDAEF